MYFLCLLNCFRRECKCGSYHSIWVQSEVSISTIILGVAVMCQALGILVFLEHMIELQEGQKLR